MAEQVEEQVVENVEPKEQKEKSLDEIMVEADEELAKKEEVVPKEVVEQKVEKEEVVPEVKKVDPLAYWTQEEKAFFGTLTPEQQKRILSMHTGAQKIYEKKTLEVSAKTKEYEPIVREYESLNKVFKPFEAQLSTINKSRTEYIGDMLQTMKAAAETPVDFICELMQAKGITPDMLADGIESYAARQKDPLYQQITPMRQQLNDLQQKINAEEEYRQQQETQKKMSAVQQQIEQFKNTKGEDGNPKYPYFEAVQEQMAVLSQAKQEYDLEKLYNEAVWLNPQIRENMWEIERQKILNEQKEIMQKNKVKNAVGLNIKNSPKDSVSKDRDMTLEEIIKETEAELEAKN